MPTVSGQYNLGLGASRAGDATYYGATFHADLAGAPFGSASYSFGTVEGISDNSNAFSATFGTELSGGRASVCPVAGVGYEMFGVEDFGIELDVSAISFGGGLGIGGSFPSGNVTILPYIVPQIQHIRLKLAATNGIENVEESDSNTVFVGLAGFGVAFGQFVIGPTIAVSSEEDSDPSFGISAGVTF